jgi:hypothetical protein
MRETLILKGKWLYDKIKFLPFQIYKLDYDFWYEMYHGYHEEGEQPDLNEEGEHYVILRTDSDFSFILDPRIGGLS